MMVILDSYDSKSFQELRKLGNQEIPYILSPIRNAGAKSAVGPAFSHY